MSKLVIHDEYNGTRWVDETLTLVQMKIDTRGGEESVTAT